MSLFSPGGFIGKVTVGALLLLVVMLAWYVVGRAMSPLRRLEVTTASGGAELNADGALRVGAYNIAHGRGDAMDGANFTGTREERAQRLDGIGALLSAENLDVLVLNEVDFDAHWSFGVNQAAHLARALGMPHTAQARNLDVSLPFFTLRFGNAILSRHPLTDCTILDFPAYSWLEALVAGKKRGLACTVTLPDGKAVRVVAVHLSHRSEDVRVASARMIAQEAKQAALPFIAAGDFNSSPPGFPRATPDAQGRTALSLLREAGLRGRPSLTPLPTELTFPSQRPDRVLDWVLVSGDVTVTSQKVLRSSLSDHNAVVATLNIP